MFFITAAESPDKPKNHANFKIKLHYSKTLRTANTKQITDSVTAETETPNSEITIYAISYKNDARVTEHNYEFHFASVKTV